MAFVPEPLVTRVNTRITHGKVTITIMAIILVRVNWSIIPITGVDVGGISNAAKYGGAFCCLSSSKELLHVVFRTLWDIVRGGGKTVDCLLGWDYHQTAKLLL